MDWGDVRPGDVLKGKGDTYLILAVTHEKDEFDLWNVHCLILVTKKRLGIVELTNWRSLIDEPFDHSVVLMRCD